MLIEKQQISHESIEDPDNLTYLTKSKEKVKLKKLVKLKIKAHFNYTLT